MDLLPHFPGELLPTGKLSASPAIFLSGRSIANCGFSRLGRKLVVGLAITGMALASLWIMMVLAWYTVIPLWVMYLAGGFHFVGGGNAMISASLLSMVSDVIPEERR